MPAVSFPVHQMLYRLPHFVVMETSHVVSMLQYADGHQLGLESSAPEKDLHQPVSLSACQPVK